MLATVQMLQNELTALQKVNKVLVTSKVAVVMPGGHSFNRNSHESMPLDTKELTIKAEVKEPTPQKQVEVSQKEYYAPKPAEVEVVHQQPAITHNVPLFDMHIDTVVEAPTLMQQ